MEIDAGNIRRSANDGMDLGAWLKRLEDRAKDKN